MAIQDLGSLADYIVNGDDWTRVDDGSILTIPSAATLANGQPVTGPLVPLGPTLKAWLWSEGECPGGTCDILFHDANTGWWFLQAGVACDGIIDAEGDTIDVATFAAGLADGINLQTGAPFAPNCALPGWAKPADWSGECDFDYYAIACDDSVIVVTLVLDQTVTATCPAPNVNRTAEGCPPGYFVNPNLQECCQPACCISYSPYQGGCCVRV
jgi:hypothetical protein